MTVEETHQYVVQATVLASLVLASIRYLFVEARQLWHVIIRQSVQPKSRVWR